MTLPAPPNHPAGVVAMSLIAAAASLAEYAHAGQVRKYTGQPYIIHPLRVAGAVSLLHGATDDMIAAAWMHDVLEDTCVSLDQIDRATNSATASLVLQLTSGKFPDLNREQRKAIQREKLAKASLHAQLIKCCDRIDNLNDLPEGQFRELYARESIQLHQAMVNGGLWPEFAVSKVLLATAQKYTPPPPESERER